MHLLNQNQTNNRVPTRALTLSRVPAVTPELRTLSSTYQSGGNQLSSCSDALLRPRPARDSAFSAPVFGVAGSVPPALSAAAGHGRTPLGDPRASRSLSGALLVVVAFRGSMHLVADGVNDEETQVDGADQQARLWPCHVRVDGSGSDLLA